MKKNKFLKLESNLLDINKGRKFLRFLFIVVCLLLTALVVYLTGGIKYVYSHLAYIPILVCGITLGLQYGILGGIVAGILLGPFMPLDVKTKEAQMFLNWFIRLLIFTTVGGVSGFASTTLRNYMKIILQNNAQNQITKIPNINSLETRENLDRTKPYLAVTIHINNYETIYTGIGSEFWALVVQNIYYDLINKLPKEATIVQAQINCFWLTIPYSNYEDDLNDLYNLLERYPVVSGVPLYMEYSLGASVIATQDLGRYAEHYRKADGLAVAAFKENKAFIPHQEISKKGHHRFEIEILARFKEALELEQTYLVYHPKVDMKTNQVTSLEALIRWNHPKYGPLEPDRFVPLIEETQLIHDLTLWVAKKSFRKQKELKAAGVNVTMSINVSAVNLYYPTFFDSFVSLLREEGINPSEVEIEVTESNLMTNIEESKRQLNRFTTLGILVSIDDYGKEYSSLAYLGGLNVQTLKIDKYFIWQMEESDVYRTIVKSTIELAHNLEMKVDAEGVETQVHMELLRSFGCDSVQGFLITPPLDEESVVDWCLEYNKNRLAM